MRRLLMLTLLSAATVCHASDHTADALIEKLAKPAPASIEFTEVRFSRLVREPLVVSGELGYSGPNSLDRRVTTPYRENTSIRGESVKVEREGEKPRSFALKHAPELRGLLKGFSALLSGDAAALHEAFDVAVNRSDDQWALRLLPIDSKAHSRIHSIEIIGSGTEPRCFNMVTADGAFSILLLGAAAKDPLSGALTEKKVYARCGFSYAEIMMPASAR